MEMLLVDDLNSCLMQPCNWRGGDLANNISNYGLEDQTLKFIPMCQYRVEVGGGGGHGGCGDMG